MPAAGEWEQADSLVTALGTADFGPAFLHAFADPLGAEHCTAFAFPRTGAPLAVLAEARSSDERSMVRDLAGAFASGEFVRDPNVQRLQRLDDGPAVFTLTPDELTDRGYRQRFYDEPRIAEELVTLTRTAGWRLYLSFYRRHGSGCFANDELDSFRRSARFAMRLLAKHLEFAALHAESATPLPQRIDRQQREQMLGRVRDTLLASGHRLTPREAEVCGAIVLGHTIAGIGLNLGISGHTVATHRKRAYAKLGISSQNELFARYFDAVRTWAAQAGLSGILGKHDSGG